MTEPGRAAWLCPGCGFVVGWVDDNNDLIIWRYPQGSIAIHCGTFTCGCGYVIEWHAARMSSILDRDVASVV